MFVRWMLRSKKGTWLRAAAMFLLPAWAHAFQPFVIKDIRVEGLQRLDVGIVFGYLPVKVGEKFTEDQATDAVRRLYKSGFFSDVRIQTDHNMVVVVVQERATIASLNFSGMSDGEKKDVTQALRQVGFAEGRIFDRSILERAELALKQQYLARGNYGVEVTSTVTPLPRNRVGISFDIFEGSQARIRKINFVGNQVFSAGTLLDQIQLTTSGWLTWYTNTDKYSREKLEGDVEIVRSFYLDRGYLEAVIEPPQVTISPDRKNIYLTLTIQEGQPYKVRSVKLAGNLLGLDSEIEHLLKIKAGETFSRAKANNSVKAITDYLGEQGYAFANVNLNPQLDRAKHEADLTFYVDPSRRVYVRRIQIGGNTNTRDEVIRREMRQKEAAWYDAGEIKLSRDRIDRLGYFGDVDIKTEPVPSSFDQVDVSVDVKEKQTGAVNLGFGYGSQDRAFISASIVQDNIFGSGTGVGLQLNTSQVNKTLAFSHTNPYWTRDGISRTTSLYWRERRPFINNEGGYKTSSGGVGMNFSVPISEYDRVLFGALFERNHVKLTEKAPLAYKQFVEQYGQTTRAFMLNVGWNKDTRDSALAPTRGYWTRLEGRVSTADLKYTMLSAQHAYFVPLSRQITLALNGIADWGHSYGGKDKNFPLIKNVYAGGIGTVRAYEGASLGPHDILNGDSLGGARRFVGNAQVYLPFLGASKDRSLRWFIFTDAGRVLPGNGMTCMAGTPSEPVEDPCGWRYSAGIGLSWQSPLGPLQVSYGRPLNAKPGDEREYFQFQVGAEF